MSERVAIFVDGANVAKGGRHHNLMVDYAQLLRWARRGGPRRADGGIVRGGGHKRAIVEAVVYLGPPAGGRVTDQRKRFVKMVESLGWNVRVASEEGQVDKTAVDRDIIIDALVKGLKGHIDVLVLLSGDGGFTRLLQTLRAVGVRVEVCAFEDAPDCLRGAADWFVDLGDSVAGGPLTLVRDD